MKIYLTSMGFVIGKWAIGFNIRINDIYHTFRLGWYPNGKLIRFYIPK